MGGGTTEGTTGAGVAQGVLPAQMSLLLPSHHLVSRVYFLPVPSQLPLSTLQLRGERTD